MYTNTINQAHTHTLDCVASNIKHSIVTHVNAIVSPLCFAYLWLQPIKSLSETLHVNCQTTLRCAVDACMYTLKRNNALSCYLNRVTYKT